jgi:hypothetical protein
MNIFLKTLCCISIVTLLSCQSDEKLSRDSDSTKVSPPTTTEFNDYWYSGKAELSSYSLKQSRYGEIRNGEVVLVFVTEPFSLSKQVKLDDPEKAGKDNISVMKLNQVRKFTTGIYDYSILTSTFTPVDFNTHPNTLKSSTSIQEWCGHTYTQLNLGKKSYHMKQYSYFEADGDTEKEIPIAFLEEELMPRLRINKGQLPLGEIDMVFSTIYSRFAYKKLESTKATISKTESDNLIHYTIQYASYDRKLTIDVQKAFPYKIDSWTEDDGDGLVTEATLQKSINEPYWSQKKNTDADKRATLELKY